MLGRFSQHPDGTWRVQPTSRGVRCVVPLTCMCSVSISTLSLADAWLCEFVPEPAVHCLDTESREELCPS